MSLHIVLAAWFLVISASRAWKGSAISMFLYLFQLHVPLEVQTLAVRAFIKKMRCSKVQMKNELEDINVYRRLYSLFSINSILIGMKFISRGFE